ncbi:MAG: RND family efflux transporter MFP subunit [Halieaceae bacterium]
MNRIKKILAPVVVLSIGFGVSALLQVTKPEPEKSEDGPRPIALYVDEVVREDVALTVHTQGEVRARTEINLIAQVGGRIVRVSPEFTEGGSFAPGETLVWIEDDDYRLAVTRADARVAAAQVNVEQADADADVARKQLRNVANPSPLALKKPQVAQARAALKAAEADLEQAQLELKRTRVTVPFEGRLKSKAVGVGQYVTAGTPLGRAFATDMVEVRLGLTDNQLASLGLPIGYVSNGDAPAVSLSAIVAGQLREWDGRLIRLDAAIDSDTRLVYAIAEVETPYVGTLNSGGMPLAVGLYVKAEIMGRQLEQAYIIPRNALRAGHKVYRVTPEGRLDVRDVEIVHQAPEYVVIKRGLEAGDEVVISPIRNPVHGMAVEAVRSGGSALVQTL